MLGQARTTLIKSRHAFYHIFRILDFNSPLNGTIPGRVGTIRGSETAQ